ncbi:MAG: hypothetical protein EA408_13595 [Marinilabiliales bacterium]|nr:MAG: hypothetical protein EA408_13595 [Marinilabiliales bacterium]
MQKINRSALLIMIVMVLLPLSCKKYEDGPWFSIYSKKERVTGNWYFELVTEDGNDMTDMYASHTLNMRRNGDLYWSQGFIGNNPWDTYGPGGEWKFVNDKNQIEMHFYYGVTEEHTLVWDITRLAYADLRLRRYENGVEIVWQLWKPY